MNQNNNLKQLKKQVNIIVDVIKKYYQGYGSGKIHTKDDLVYIEIQYFKLRLIYDYQTRELYVVNKNNKHGNFNFNIDHKLNNYGLTAKQMRHIENIFKVELEVD